MPALLLALVLTATAAVPGSAQGPLEPPLAADVVVVDGVEHRGRVRRRHGDTVRLEVDGRRLEWPRDEVERVSTRADRAAAWLGKRRPGQDAETRWRLVEAAGAAGLPQLARLAALELLLAAPDFEPARELLGHRGEPGAWRRRLDGRWLDELGYARAATEGRGLQLASEHFVVATDAGLERGLGVAFDLERLHARWNAEFAPSFGAAETVEPVRVDVRARVADAEVHASDFPLPYYDPGRLLGSVLTVDPRVVTWFEPLAERPVWLFDLAAQALLYQDVLEERLVEVPRDTSRYRENAALETGFGAVVQRTMAGPPGFAEIVPYAPDPITLELARRRSRTAPVAGRSPELPYLLTLGFERLQLDARENALLRAKLELFAAWLMDPRTRLGQGSQARSGPQALAEIVRATYVQAKGLSSSAWDRALGEKAERLEDDWRGFLDRL